MVRLFCLLSSGSASLAYEPIRPLDDLHHYLV